MKKTTIAISCYLMMAMIILSLALAGCGGGQGTTDSSNADVTFLDQAMTPAQIDTLLAGDQAFAMVEREEGIKFIPITLGERYQVGANDYLTFRDADLQFGSGDSGSPILNPDGLTIGALSGSFGGDNIVITPITNMLSAVGQAPGTATASMAKTQLAWFATGVSATGREELRNAGIPITDAVPIPVTNQAAVAAAVSEEIHTVAPGRSMAAMLVEGPLVNIYAIGTVTHAVSDTQMIAFGHPLFWNGQSNFPIPVTPAKVIQFIHDPVWGNYKLAVPVGAIQGGIVQDRSAAIMVDTTATIQRVGLTINVGGITTRHLVCRMNELNLADYYVYSVFREIVENQLDSGSPGTLQTSVLLTYSDNSTRTIDLGAKDWSASAYLDVWNSFSAEFSTINEIEITLN